MQKIVDEVVRRLKNQPKKALVVFSGAAIGFTEAMASLKKLREEGWQLKAFLSDEAMKVLTPSYIQETLGLDEIYCSESHVPQRELYGEVDQIIIATTTVNTAAKIAHGICDNEMLTLINHGIMAGTPCICAIDGACPDNKVRAQLGMGNSPEGYRKLLKSNLRALKEFGIKLVSGEELYDGCTGKTLEARVQETKPAEVVDPYDSDGGVITKKIISRGDVLMHRNAGTIKVPQGAIVTEYAKEAIQSFGLRLERI